MSAKSGSKRKTPGDRVAARKSSPPDRGPVKETMPEDPTAADAKAGKGAGAAATEILADEQSAQRIAEHGEQLLDERETTATKAARIVQEVAQRKPEAVVPLVDKLVKGLLSPHKRVVQTAADALPEVARVAPARVARHLELLKTSFEKASLEGQDGLVRTFAALCTASVAYQKRLEPVLTKALDVADAKTLQRWTEIVLPALKGEPHARARAVVERRLYQIPRVVAQKIADFLGLKLRPSYRG